MVINRHHRATSGQVASSGKIRPELHTPRIETSAFRYQTFGSTTTAGAAMLAPTRTLEEETILMPLSMEPEGHHHLMPWNSTATTASSTLCVVRGLR